MKLIRLLYLGLANVAGFFLGIITLAVLLIANHPLQAIGWALIVYGACFVIGVILVIIDPKKLGS